MVYTGPLGASGRLPVSVFEPLRDDHVHQAVDAISAGAPIDPFGSSTDYDLLTDDGHRLPPKAVFGLAASVALGFQVLPKHFTGGIGTYCFNVIERAGYSIVPKGAEIPPSVEDREWLEGSPRLALHLKRERAWGLAQAKKRSFVKENGRLLCERCGFDPESALGPHGDASIEVHHKTVQVADMPADHATTTADLECLCANCHRFVHRLLKLGIKDERP
jgi:5-methylcytosine-specific restriction protein A